LNRDILIFVAVVAPLAILQLGLLAWALIDIIKRERVKGGNKLVCVLVILLVSTLGPIAYLIWGREEPSVVDPVEDRPPYA